MRIGLISCTKSQSPYAASARELFSASALFRAALAYLEPRADFVYVLSAKYGLLPLDQVAAPYDQMLQEAGVEYQRDWARQVFASLEQRHGPSLEGITFEFHVRAIYSAELRSLLEAAGADCCSPVEHMKSGPRLQFYEEADPRRHRPVVRNMANRRPARPEGFHRHGWYQFAVEPVEGELAPARRRLVLPAGVVAPELDGSGVYLYFAGRRCLYVGKAADKGVLAQAADHLSGAGADEVSPVIQEDATTLLIRPTEDERAARRLELQETVLQEPVLNERFLYATATEKRRYRQGEAARPRDPEQVFGLPVHVEVWLAAALLHDEGHETFARARLLQEIAQRFGDTRLGVQSFSTICVVNAPNHARSEYNYLFRIGRGKYRLRRPADALHPSRRSSGGTSPDLSDIPQRYRELWRRWR